MERSLPLGVCLPDSLVLFREYSARFSVQPSRPTSLVGELIFEVCVLAIANSSIGDLNNRLDDFYLESATMRLAQEWLLENEYHLAKDDDRTEDWMGE